MRRSLLAIGLVLAASAASAQPPPSSAVPPPTTSPQQRQGVVDLAYVLGEAHALHRACTGPEDNTWRARMGRLLQVEAPDAPYRQRLMDSFNAGFTARSAPSSPPAPPGPCRPSRRWRRAAAPCRDISRQAY